MKVVLVFIRALSISRYPTFRPCIHRSIYHPSLMVQRSQRIHTISSTQCWKCGQSLNSSKLQHFCTNKSCKAIQPVAEKSSYFNLFGLQNEFEIDNKHLTTVYKATMNLLHPDKTIGWSGREKEYADLQSSLINKAYRTLQKPVPRALYLLQLNGRTIEESDLDLETEFLMEMLEFNEQVATATDSGLLEDLFNTNRKLLNILLDEISQAFDNNDLDLALKLVARTKYLLNIEEQIKRKTFLH